MIFPVRMVYRTCENAVGVVLRILTQYGQIGRRAHFDSAVPGSKTASGVCCQRRKDLAIAHSGARHEGEFECCVISIRVADIGTK